MQRRFRRGATTCCGFQQGSGNFSVSRSSATHLQIKCLNVSTVEPRLYPRETTWVSSECPHTEPCLTPSLAIVVASTRLDRRNQLVAKVFAFPSNGARVRKIHPDEQKWYLRLKREMAGEPFDQDWRVVDTNLGTCLGPDLEVSRQGSSCYGNMVASTLLCHITGFCSHFCCVSGVSDGARRSLEWDLYTWRIRFGRSFHVRESGQMPRAYGDDISQLLAALIIALSWYSLERRAEGCPGAKTFPEP